MDLEDIRDRLSDLEKSFENLSEASISESRIKAIERNVSSLENDVNTIKSEISDVEKDMVRIDTEANQLPPKLQRLPNAKYLDDMITSVGDKMEQKIDDVSRNSISKRELYSYAALISFFVSLIVGIVTFLLTYPG